MPKRVAVRDRDVRPRVEATLERVNPRRWYAALMDFGSALKGRVPNPNARSVHYVRQAPFESSNRQIRGRILGLLDEQGAMPAGRIESSLAAEAGRVRLSLEAPETDGLLVCEEGIYRIAQ